MIFWAGLALALFQLFVPVLTDLYDMQLRALHVVLATATILLAVPLSRKKTLLFFDCTERLSKVDKQLAHYISDEYKPCILVVNKWDKLAGQMPT
jgi:TRAP-type uncharacterized transport system fused permease subunit